MSNFWAKKDLYINVSKVMQRMRITVDDFPLKASQLFEHFPEVKIEYKKFANCGFGGALYKGKYKSNIIINSSLPERDQNFNALHEFYHFIWHDAGDYCYFDAGVVIQDPILEWQCNEAAAQTLVPYKDFIPRFLRMAASMEENYESIDDLYSSLANHYQVNPIVINYRVSGLDNEIYQYYSGTPIDKLDILSNRQKLEKHKSLDEIRKILGFLDLKSYK